MVAGLLADLQLEELALALEVTAGIFSYMEGTPNLQI